MTFRQGSLLALGAPELPAEVGPVDRLDLGHGAWIDHAPGWLPGSDAWLERLRAELPWQDLERPMYERVVAVPRRVCHLGRGADVPCGLERLGELFDAHYRRPFRSIGCNWYRDGRDSVAWHADKVPMPGDSIIAIVAVGERRPFGLRPLHGGGRSRRWLLGEGDVLVMGGTTQAHWQHAVPKVAIAGERISVMVRG